MTVYVILAYDKDYYTFESYLGVFRTRDEAKKFIDDDYWANSFDGMYYPNHKEYKIKEEKFKCFRTLMCESLPGH